MHIVRLTVTNYGPFEGKHTIELSPSVYGVIARHDTDAGRSNWIGKTWALGATRYALYGAHYASTEDDVIHRGEEACEVVLDLNDGTRIARRRKHGKSTRLSASIAGRAAAEQKRAQDAIVEHLRMTLEDFDASCFVQQKQIARMVLARPAERSEIVNAWLELDGLKKAERGGQDELRALLDKRSKVDSEIALLQVNVAEGFAEQDCLELIDRLEKELAALVEEHLANKALMKEARDRALQVELAAEFDELVVEGRAKKASLEALVADLEVSESSEVIDERTTQAIGRRTEAQIRHDQCQSVASGSFDGECPIMQAPCPAKTEVESTRVDAKKRLAVIRGELDTFDRQVDEAKAARAEVDTLARQIDRAERELERIRDDASERADAHDYIAEHPDEPDSERLHAVEVRLEQSIIDMSADLQVARREYEAWEQSREALKAARAKRGPLDDQIQTAQEAVAVMKGAAKEIAQAALSEIETLANGLLRQASIDLTIAVQWAREGRGLATHCDACGTPFPSSQREKVCQQCSKARGPKIVEKLELDISNRSGAADDIAGLAFQLAASSWLRKKRGSDWSVVFVDEPFGALDETNSRNLSSHLHSLIRGAFGFEQGFLVAHDAAIMASMPARVVVSGGETGGSRLSVE